MGRKKKEEVVETTKKTKKTSTTTIIAEDGTIMTLADIEKKLLKKAKSSGTIEQTEIYDALADYEIDDEAVNELMQFFADNNIKVINYIFEVPSWNFNL